MKKLFSVLMVLTVITSFFDTKVFAASTAMLTPTLGSAELGQLKVCKAAGVGVTVGKLFTINVNNIAYSVPAGPTDGGYCVLAGQFPVNTQVTVQESIPNGYYVSRIEVKPDRSTSKDLSLGKAIVEIGSGVTEVIITNRATGSPTPVITSTPRPSHTPTATPRCAPNCTPTPTSIPQGRLQICKEADGAGVSGYFDFDFANRSKTIPVGACSALITVDAGTLTITEVAQAGYSVTDIYTIPADRLISKNLNARTIRVTIVQGNAASQTIVVFRNRAVTSNGTNTPTHTPTPTGSLTTTPTPTSTGSITPTFTPTSTGSTTPTPTGTTPPSICPPSVIFANFSSISGGQSVEGLGVVAPYLNIDAKGTAVKVLQSAQPLIYFAPPSSGTINAGLAGDGGFSDVITKNAFQAHLYTFTFAPGVSVTNFSLHMLDYGDWNPSLSTSHLVHMTAYNANGNVVSREELNYTTLAEVTPRSSSLYGDLLFNGDAVAAPLGQPGNWIWNVSGNGIVKIVLEFGAGYDPNIAFDLLSFTTECASCQSLTGANFSSIPAGQSVEGLGVVAPYLNIDAKGTAVTVLQSTAPAVYFAPPGSGTMNGGLAGDGGFSDVITKNALQAHLYTFTFAPGVSVTNFSLHMLDYGDLNPSLSTSHLVHMTAYNANGNVVSREELNYTTLAEAAPRSSSLYGDLVFNGDAVAAPLGQPGNWIWNVSGNGIVKIVLEFGAGYDPNIAFDLLSYNVVCQ